MNRRGLHEKDKIIDNCNKASETLNKCFAKLKKYLKLKIGVEKKFETYVNKTSQQHLKQRTFSFRECIQTETLETCKKLCKSKAIVFKDNLMKVTKFPGSYFFPTQYQLSSTIV